jgi:acyl carrier protein
MKFQSENDLVNLIIKWIKQDRQTTGFSVPHITPDTDLIESGLLDSSGFIELILFLESHTNSQIDLTQIDPSEFTVIRNLSRIASANRRPTISNAVCDELKC